MQGSLNFHNARSNTISPRYQVRGLFVNAIAGQDFKLEENDI